MKNTKILFYLIIGVLALNGSAHGDLLSESLSAESVNLSEAKQSQNKIDAIYEEKSSDLQDLRLTTTEIAQLEIYNRQLKAIISDQESQKSSIKQQIKDIKVTQQGIMPLMDRMLTMLDQFIENDIPFLLDERLTRVATLRSLLLSSEVTISEKFRRVLEAFQIELEFGRTIEAYRGKNSDGRIVDYLRLGRVGFYYVYLNSNDSFAWNVKTKSWHKLSDSEYNNINKGLQVARKQSAPSLLNLQVNTIKEIH